MQNHFVQLYLPLTKHKISHGKFTQTQYNLVSREPYKLCYQKYYYSNHADKKPVSVASALKLMLPLASDWKVIGALLSLPCDLLDKIAADEDRANDRLLAVLKEWLKQVNPIPSWAMLADAVKPFNETIAKKLLDENISLG